MTREIDQAARAYHRIAAENGRALESTVREISSGLRVNRASDDAASAAIGARLSFRQADSDAVSIDTAKSSAKLQIIDGTLGDIGDLLVRLKTVALQAANGALSDMERAFLDTEFTSLRDEIDRIGRDAAYAGQPLSGGTVFSSDFDNASALDAVTLKGGGGPGLPAVNNGLLELTNLGDLFGFSGLVSNDTFSLRSGLVADFRYFAGDPAAPADGLTFFLVDGDRYDPAVDPLGGGGGDLGYRGINGGFVGVAFDEFGNFTDFNTPPLGFLPDHVSVAVGDDVVPSSITNVTPFGGIGGGFRDVRVEVTSTLELTIRMSFDDGANFVSILDNFDLTAATTDRPENLRFGFSASVGGLSNDYAIDRVTVVTGGSFSGLAGLGPTPDTRRIDLPLFNLTAGSFGLSGTQIRTQTQAENAVASVDFGIEQLLRYRADIGSALSVVEGLSDVNALNALNLEQARASLLAANIARATVNLAAEIVRQNAGIEMLARVHDLSSASVLGLIDTIEV